MYSCSDSFLVFKLFVRKKKLVECQTTCILICSLEGFLHVWMLDMSCITHYSNYMYSNLPFWAVNKEQHENWTFLKPELAGPKVGSTTSGLEPKIQHSSD